MSAGESPLLHARHASLLLIDVQQRLVPAIDGGAAIVEQCGWLARLAVARGVPIVMTEHMAAKIGATVARLAAAAAGARIVGKAHFSAARAGAFAGTAVQDRPQVVVGGIEAHVCVLQTALDLQAQGKSVFVVAEACGSRNAHDKELAFARMRQHGVEIVSREMVAFEWLERADTDVFGSVLREFIR
jgi:nicotinamidase-related amidase